MEADSTTTNKSNSWQEAFAGTIPFLLWGLLFIAGEIPASRELPNWVFNYLFLALLIIPPIGMCLGWINGFPRWSYPYVSHAITFSVFAMNVSSPDILSEALWGWYALAPLTIAVGIALLVTRSTEAIIKFFTNVWKDWTLLSFGIFGLLPLRVVFSFDVTDRVYSFYVMLALALLMASAALVHMRAGRPWHRVAVLLVASTLMATIVEGAHLLYWQGTGQLHLGQSIIRWVTIALATLFPFLIEIWRRATYKWEQAILSSV